MRLVELIKEIPKSEFKSSEGFLFSKIGRDGIFDWLDFNEGQILDNMYFFQYSGDKEVQSFFSKYAEYYEDELSVSEDVICGEHICGEIISKVMPFVAQEVVLKFKMKWNRLHKIFESQISPLINEYYQVIETPNLVHDTEIAVNSNVSTSVTSQADVDTYGFNSSSSTPTGKTGTTQTHNTSGSKDDNTSSSVTTETGTKAITYEGMRGQSQIELLEKEIEVMKWNFYEQLFDDVDTLITLPKYNL